MQPKRFDRLLAGTLALMFWGLLAMTLLKIEPEVVADILIPGLYLPFVGLWFLAVTITVSGIRWNLVKGLVWGVASTIYLILRLYELGNILNILLILGLLITFEYYRYTYRKKVD
jgi:hypothetical protein